MNAKHRRQYPETGLSISQGEHFQENYWKSLMCGSLGEAFQEVLLEPVLCSRSEITQT
ncbi:hypothetical protein PCAR4_290078 [Paraburkholderia caribensis]|nr:hypothetical protein PCAR4_290078 [Paraburkholderia caribensis]